ncbi:MAG: hypothetical protein FH748_12845 [Balneolaceae bacterium]|nr:hypothetical protein [Balneolaceae bacterium]
MRTQIVCPGIFDITLIIEFPDGLASVWSTMTTPVAMNGETATVWFARLTHPSRAVDILTGEGNN